jgi:hypothetical protein
LAPLRAQDLNLPVYSRIMPSMPVGRSTKTVRFGDKDRALWQKTAVSTSP